MALERWRRLRADAAESSKTTGPARRKRGADAANADAANNSRTLSDDKAVDNVSPRDTAASICGPPQSPFLAMK